MGLSNTGFAKCTYCGAEYMIFTIFNRDMQGLAKCWKSRHEYKCATRTPEQRKSWAKPYIGKGRVESSIVIDLDHYGFIDDHPRKND